MGVLRGARIFGALQHTHAHMRTHTRIHTHTHAHTHTHTHTHTHKYMDTDVYVQKPLKVITQGIYLRTYKYS